MQRTVAMAFLEPLRTRLRLFLFGTPDDVRDRLWDRRGAAYWIADRRRSGMISVHRSLEDLWALPLSRIAREPRAVLDRVVPEDRDRVRELLDARPDVRLEDEYRIRAANGRVRWLNEQIVPLAGDRDGEPRLYAGIVREITDRRRVEAELERARARLHQALAALPDPVFLQDSRGVYRVVNDAAATMLGGGREGLVGARPEDVLPPTTARNLEELRERALSEGGWSISEVHLPPRQEGGPALRLEMACQPMSSPGGEEGDAEDAAGRWTIGVALRVDERPRG